MWLKILACVLMFFDHYAHLFRTTLSPEMYYVIRLVGRLAFPAFAYLIVVGMRRTHDVRRYLSRLFIMAVVTQALFKLTEILFGVELWTNVLFTFSFGLIGLIGLELLLYGWPDMSLILKPVSAQGPAAKPPGEYNQRVNLHGLSLDRKTAVLLGMFFLALCLGLTLILDPDYGVYGIVAIFIFYFTDLYGRAQNEEDKFPDQIPDNSPRSRSYLPMFTLFLIYNLIMSLGNLNENISIPYSFLQAFSSFAVPLFPLAFTGKKPNTLIKYAFYLFYPVHIVVLAVLSKLLI